MSTFKIPESVLVVVHTGGLDVLLIRRADAAEFWQSVTGSKDTLGEDVRTTALREVAEETGIHVQPGQLRDWQMHNIYTIYPQWRHRYAPDVTLNREHLFSLQVPEGTPVVLHPREHTAYMWLPYHAAAQACFSPSNAEAILMLPRFCP